MHVSYRTIVQPWAIIGWVSATLNDLTEVTCLVPPSGKKRVNICACSVVWLEFLSLASVASIL